MRRKKRIWMRMGGKVCFEGGEQGKRLSKETTAGQEEQFLHSKTDKRRWDKNGSKQVSS